MFTRQTLIRTTVAAAMLSAVVASLPVQAGPLGGALGGAAGGAFGGGMGGGMGGAFGGTMGSAMGGSFRPGNVNGSGMVVGQGAFTGRSADMDMPNIGKGVGKARDGGADLQALGQGAATGVGQASNQTASATQPASPTNAMLSTQREVLARDGMVSSTSTLTGAVERGTVAKPEAPAVPSTPSPSIANRENTAPAPVANQSLTNASARTSKTNSAKLHGTELSAGGRGDAQAQRNSASFSSSASTQGSYKRP